MSIPCDIVLLPNEELAKTAIAASQALAKYDPFFTLEIGKFYPHMSLYMFQLEESDIERVNAVLQDIAAGQTVVHGHATGYKMGEGFAVGYVDPDYEVTDELHALQQTIVAAVNPIRSDMRQSDKEKMVDATGIKLENLQKYGYVSIGQLFRPHITLTRLKENVPEALNDLPDISLFSGAFDRIGLFEMGPNGTCIRKIAEFPLAKTSV